MQTIECWSRPAGAGDAEQAAAVRFAGALQRQIAPIHGGGRLNASCLLRIGSFETILVIQAGKASLKRPHPAMNGTDLVIEASAQALEQFWQPVPAPGWHDIFALCKRGQMRFQGNLLPLMTHLQYFKDLLALPRGDA